jgi:hypothetical protein
VTNLILGVICLFVQIQFTVYFSVAARPSLVFWRQWVRKSVVSAIGYRVWVLSFFPSGTPSDYGDCAEQVSQ